MTLDWKELIGIAATVFVFIGFTQSSPVRIRLVNSIGSILFVVYGLLIGAFSVWLLNGACLILNIYKVVYEIRHPAPYVRYVETRHPGEVPDIHMVIVDHSKPPKNKKIEKQSPQISENSIKF